MQICKVGIPVVAITKTMNLLSCLGASSTVSQYTLREYSKRRLEILRQFLGRQNRQVDLSFPSIGVHCREALVPAGVLVVSDAIVASAFEVRAWQRG